MRDTVISVKSRGRIPAELSRVNMTSARPRAERFAVPLKMTSSIFWLRTEEGACAPSTHAMASTTFDLPEPFGPTTTVTPGSISMTVESAKDLKPLRVRDFRNTAKSTVIETAQCRPMASPLATRAVRRRAPCNHDSANGSFSTGQASESFASIDPMTLLKAADIALNVHILRILQR